MSGLYAPILMYHHIGDATRGRFGVSAGAFARQMAWLDDNGFQTVSIDRIAHALRGGPSLPPRPVALTFDDGWRSQFLNALPVMRDHGMRATFYLVARYITPGGQFMDWNDLDVVAGAGHWFGSHSGKHVQQTSLAGAALAADMIAARSLIRHRMGILTTTHAYPYGAVNPSVERAARSAGYSAAVGVWSRARQTADMLFRLGRIEVRGDMSFAQFTAALS